MAVSVLEEKSEITMKYFFYGFTCIVLSSIMKAFLLHEFYNALTVSGALLFAAFYLSWVGNRIKNRLYVNRKLALHGDITDS